MAVATNNATAATTPASCDGYVVSTLDTSATETIPLAVGANARVIVGALQESAWSAGSVMLMAGLSQAGRYYFTGTRLIKDDGTGTIGMEWAGDVADANCWVKLKVSSDFAGTCNVELATQSRDARPAS